MSWEDVQAAQALIRPSALREFAVEVLKVSWEDVGGLGDVKQKLKEAVQWPQQHPEALAKLGAKARVSSSVCVPLTARGMCGCKRAHLCGACVCTRAQGVVGMPVESGPLGRLAHIGAAELGEPAVMQEYSGNKL